MVALFATMFASATTLAAWDVQNNGSNWLTQLPAVATNSNIVVTDIVVGSGLTGSGSAAGYSFGGSVVANSTLATAITNNAYFTMTIKAAAGKTLSLAGFSTWFTRKSGTGTTQIVVQYSLDGVTFSDAGTVTVTSTAAPGSNTPLTFSQAARTALTDLPSATTVTLRFVVVSTVNASIYLVAGNSGTNMTSRMVLESVLYEPDVNAPVPTKPAANVKSIYSDTYTNACTWGYGSWGQSTAGANFTVAGTTGNTIRKLTNFNYLGYELNGNQPLDWSTMEYLHIDVWTPNSTQFQITPIWGSAAEALYTCTPLNQGAWNSYDIPLTSFAGIDKTKLYQIKIVGVGGLAGTVAQTATNVAFVDNIYFWGSGTKVATPVITPAVGYFDAPIPVSITCAESGATIHYTTDGTTPTTSSPTYSASFNVNAPATVKAFAEKAGMSDSEVATANYYVRTDPLLIDDLEGANKGWQTVGSYQEIRTNAYPDCLNSSAKVLYTDRSVGNVDYSGAILGGTGFGGPVTGFQYLKAKMYRNNTNVPNVKVTDNATYGTLDLVPMSNITMVANQWQDVVFDLAGRPLDYIMWMVDRSATISATVWMLVDDIVLSNDPTPRQCVLQQVATPVISPAGGTVTAPVTVSISCSETGASIYYSTDGSTPSATSATSTLYSTAFQVTATTTVKAIAVKSGMADSDVASAIYTFQAPATTPNVVISGVYGGGGNSGAPVLNDYIELYNTTASPIDLGGWTIYYGAATGTNATAANTFTFAAGTMIGAHDFLLLKASKGAGTQTNPYTFDLDISGAAGGNFAMAAGAGKVLLLSAYKDLTATNSLPTTLAGIQALTGFVDYVPFGSTSTPKVGTSMVDLSATLAATRTITGTTVSYVPDMSIDFSVVTLTASVPRHSTGTTTTVATPTFSPAGGNVTAPVDVTISCATAGATIHYTTDGSAPTETSATYSTPLNITATTTVKAIAVKSGMTNSEVATATYTFQSVTEVANILAFTALAENTVAKITGAITAVYQNGNNLFVQDASGWLMIYGNPGGKTYHSGDLITGITGKFLTYTSASSGTYPEMDITGMTLPDGVPGTAAVPYTTTPGALTNADLNRFIKFENAEIAENITYATTGQAEDGKIVNGDGTMIIRNHYKLVQGTFVAGDKVNVTGLVRMFNSAIQIYLLSIEKVQVGLKDVKDNSIEMYVSNGALNVISEGGVIEIFTVLGIKVAEVNANYGITTINGLPNNQLLIVKIGNKNGKVVVR